MSNVKKIQFLRQRRIRLWRTISNKRGFSIVEALIGIALVSIVFAGIFGAYRLGVKMVWLNKAKVGASAIAAGHVELIRGLPYESVGLKNAVLPNAAGILDATVLETAGGVQYTTTISAVYAVDAADGMGMSDSCNWDYKKISVKTAWNGDYPGEVVFLTDIAPQSQAQEAQTCLSQPGGVLTIRVSNSSGIMISSPVIEIHDPLSGQLVDYKVPNTGEYSFALPVGMYRVLISKTGYNNIRTYGTQELAAPNDPDLMVFNGAATEKSFSIDLAAAISIDAVSPSGLSDFSDTFADQQKISEFNGTEIDGGALALIGPAPFLASGSAVSTEINPVDLVGWGEFSFTDDRPGGTNIIYQILYFDGVDWILVPDSCVGGNGLGLTASPVQLSGIPAAAYPKLKIKAVLSSGDPAATPKINNWKINWVSNVGAPFSNAIVHVRGQKTIGKDSAGNDVYKYSRDLALDSSGHADLADMENDFYDFSVVAAGVNLIGASPGMPLNVAPGAFAATVLYLNAQNSLLLEVGDYDSLDPIFGASVHLVNASIGYDSVQNTAANGQVYIAPLQNAVYDLEISAPGYETYAGNVAVLGQTLKSINLEVED